MDAWRHGGRQRLYESALNDVEYFFGKPIPFVPSIARRMNSDDPEERDEAWKEAARL